MDGYVLIASGIGVGVILLIGLAKLYDRFRGSRRSATQEDELASTPNQRA